MKDISERLQWNRKICKRKKKKLMDRHIMMWNLRKFWLEEKIVRHKKVGDRVDTEDLEQKEGVVGINSQGCCRN